MSGNSGNEIRLAWGVHLVGSLPVGSPDEAFQLPAEILGHRLRRIGDGELGERQGWIGWQLPKFLANPQLEMVQPDADPDETDERTSRAPTLTRPGIQPKPGVDPADVTFDVGYAAAAIESFERFRGLQDQGEIPASWRFQVSLPTPLSPVAVFWAPASRAAIEPVFERAMLAEVAEILAAIPSEKLAIQWDAVAELAFLEHFTEPWFPDVLDGVVERMARLGNSIPAGVELGYHLCYGDFNHEHFKDPVDTSWLVKVANGIHERLDRPLNWIHLPVPRDRHDREYFAPLERLHLDPDTELYLGLVHYTDGVEGTLRRIEAAHSVVDGFGVGTECGFGRRPPETVPGLLRIHAAVAEPVS